MKVLMVDDEIYNLQMLKKEIDWTGLNIDEVRTAEDGEEARLVMQEYLPDILLVDVEMPKMSGLELIKWVKENNLDMEIIILSCHDKFSYAQTAISLGVREYIIKPFRLEELYVSLSKAVFERSKKEEEKLGNKKSRFLSERSVLQRVFNHEIINQRMLTETLRSTDGGVKANGPCRMIYIGVNRSDITASNYEREQFEFILENVTSEILELEASGAHAIRSLREPFYFLIYFLSLDDTELKQKVNNLISIGERYIKLPLYICVSREDTLTEVVNQKENIEDYYLKCLKLGNSSIHFIGENQVSESGSRIGIEDEVLLTVLRQERYAEFTRYVRESMVNFEKEGRLNLSVMKNIERAVSHAMYKLCDERELPVLEIFAEDTVSKLQKEASFGIPAMLKYITYTIACIQNGQKIKREDCGVVDQAKKYITQHYRENIGRDDIANECHVSPGYLSKVFAESMGINMREYINQYRVNESKRLLRDPDKSIGYVAMEVGFENLSYFSTVFKKVCGETPAEWRKKIFL